MGEADIATNLDNARLRLFNSYQKKNSEPFIEDMTEEYVEEDNKKMLLTEYINWISTTAITKYLDEYLNSNSTLKINASTLKNYLIKLILVLKDKFPNHFAWGESEWNTRMIIEEFNKKCNIFQVRGNVDVYKYTKRGIYSKASPCLNVIYYHWISNIYL